jgi:hypothetical protein
MSETNAKLLRKAQAALDPNWTNPALSKQLKRQWHRMTGRQRAAFRRKYRPRPHRAEHAENRKALAEMVARMDEVYATEYGGGSHA